MPGMDGLPHHMSDETPRRAVQEERTRKLQDTLDEGRRLCAEEELEIAVKKAERTEPDYSKCLPRFNEESIRLLHAAIGLVTESAEFLDPLKKWLYYGKEIDQINLIEELGDSSWYGRVACSALKVTFLEIIERNVRKLETRYPKKFSEESAIVRDLGAERKVLEKAPVPTSLTPAFQAAIQTDLSRILEGFIPTRAVHGGIEEDFQQPRLTGSERHRLLRELEEYVNKWKNSLQEARDAYTALRENYRVLAEQHAALEERMADLGRDE